MKNVLILVLILLPMLGYTNPTYKLGEGQTHFLATGNPGFLKINADGKAPEGSFSIVDGKLSGTCSVDLTSFDTGMSLRNKHMKEKYLETTEFPKAELTIENYVLPKDWSLKTSALKDNKIPAQIKIHGVVKPVNVTVSINKEADLTANFSVKISNFKIDVPSFMGVTVADQVEVKVVSQILPVTTQAL